MMACIIDWAASKTAPGAGVAIYQHVLKLTDGLIGVGGSDDAQRVLPRMGFKARQELETVRAGYATSAKIPGHSNENLERRGAVRKKCSPGIYPGGC